MECSSPALRTLGSRDSLRPTNFIYLSCNLGPHTTTCSQVHDSFPTLQQAGIHFHAPVDCPPLPPPLFRPLSHPVCFNRNAALGGCCRFTSLAPIPCGYYCTIRSCGRALGHRHRRRHSLMNKSCLKSVKSRGSTIEYSTIARSHSSSSGFPPEKSARDSE